jgi:hypothetical protein
MRHARLIQDPDGEGNATVAADEPVTSPDQHKPTNRRAARTGGIMTILILLALTRGNHMGNTENIWLVGLAALIALIIAVDWLLRKNGLRS